MFGTCIRDLDLDLRTWLEGAEIKDGFKICCEAGYGPQSFVLISMSNSRCPEILERKGRIWQ
jgi:hypothetical protein